MQARSSSLFALGLVSLSLVAACDKPPEIDRVLVSRVVMLNDESSVISVTVLDESGLDDIVGVQLWSEDLAYWYGSLGEVSDGVFETTIDWGRLGQYAPIYFDFPIKRAVVVVAEDNEGGSDRKTVVFELQCRAGEHACDGSCYPVDVNCADL
ncbi:MAG: hypothetical protein R3B09_14985 [Nannocystaceae bacterium]